MPSIITNIIIRSSDLEDGRDFRTDVFWRKTELSVLGRVLSCGQLSHSHLTITLTSQSQLLHNQLPHNHTYPHNHSYFTITLTPQSQLPHNNTYPTITQLSHNQLLHNHTYPTITVISQ